MSEESSSQDATAEAFGPLLSISESSLISLATTIRQKELGESTSSGSLISNINGSYNLVYVLLLDGVKVVIRVPASGWGDNWTETAARALESQVATLRLIYAKTSISVPQVYAFDTSKDNEIDAPFICMSFLPGETVMKAWFEDQGPVPLEQKRLRILTSLSRYMAQLAELTFEQVGSLFESQDGTISIGPCFDWDERDDGTISVEASGPFNSAGSYLREHFVLRNNKSEWGIAEDKLIPVIMSRLPIYNPAEGFVLCPPDFDPQNVMTDETGNVTGIIDWDLAQTLPRCVGYSRYPSWITRDWDPLMYGWPRFKDSENSPEELERYREHYSRAMGELLVQKGGGSYTKKSHIWEAAWIASLNTVNRLEICRKLVQAAIGDDGTATEVLYDIGAGLLEEDEWSSIETKLRQLFSITTDPWLDIPSR